MIKNRILMYIAGVAKRVEEVCVDHMVDARIFHRTLNLDLEPKIEPNEIGSRFSQLLKKDDKAAQKFGEGFVRGQNNMKEDSRLRYYKKLSKRGASFKFGKGVKHDADHYDEMNQYLDKGF